MAQSQAFTLTRAQYLTDFRVTPVLILAALIAGLWTDSVLSVIGWTFAGYVAWTLSEWVTHKHLFHRAFRREHWAHHLRPASDIGVKPVYTVTAQLALGASLTWLAGGAGAALFAGYSAGYVVYLATHHAFHRWTIPPGTFLRAAYERHEWHHKGNEVNFNVLIPWADRLFGTYYQPPAGVIK